MNRLRTSLGLLALLLSGGIASATHIPPQRASQIAYRFLQTVAPTSARSSSSLHASEAPAFYIYHRDDATGGFVLVNKDDSRGAILGYSTSGRFVLDSLPEGLRELFLQLPTSSPSSSAGQARALHFPQPVKAAIAPLLKSKWGQIGYAYNSYTPLSGSQHTPSGCVAVAMAQIMYHHKWPLQGKGTHTHPNATFGFGTTDLSQHTYAWQEMLPVYGPEQLYNRRGIPYPPDAPRFTSVSRLMLDAGITVNMFYSGAYSGSFSELVPRAMEEYFDYEASPLLGAKRIGQEELEQLIEAELRAGFPLYISGGNSRGRGHAWVLDGMDSHGLFHMNFGWEGQSDGYYSLRAISPKQLGAEFAGQRPAFTSNLQLIALHPKKVGSAPLDKDSPLLQPRLTAQIESYLRLIKQSQTQLLVEMSYLTNGSGKAFTGDYGYGLYDEGGRLLTIYPSKYHPQGGYATLVADGSIIKPEQDVLPVGDLTDGYYELRLMSSEREGEDGWKAWREILHTPTLGLNRQGGKFSIIEEHGLDRGIQPLTQPLHGTLQPGTQVQIGLLLKNLTGNTPDLSLSLQLLDQAGRQLSTTTTAAPVTFPARGQVLTYFQLSLPEELTPGRYRLALEARQGTSAVPVQRYRLSQDLFIQVEAPQPGRLELLYAEALSSSPIRLSSFSLLDLQENPDLSLRLHLLRAPEETTKTERLRVYLVDTERDERLFCGETSVSALRASSTPTRFTTRPLGAAVGSELREGRIYRLSIEGMQGAKSYDLWPTTLEQAYISFRGANKPTPSPAPSQKQALAAKDFEETPIPTPPTPEITPVDTPEAATPTYRYFSREQRLHLTGIDLQQVEIFTLTGTRLHQQQLSGQGELDLSLAGYPAGIYLIRLRAGGQVHTYRLAR